MFFILILEKSVSLLKDELFLSVTWTKSTQINQWKYIDEARFKKFGKSEHVPLISRDAAAGNWTNVEVV